MWKSDKQRKWGHTQAGVKALGGKSAVAEWDKASKKYKKMKAGNGVEYDSKSGKKLKKVKPKIVINNKMKAYGQTDTKTGVVEINRKKHKGDKKQLADTIKHEIYHVKHPKATEKTTYKSTGKLENISHSEQANLIAKLRHKKLNQTTGVLKKKLKLKGKVEPGDMIKKFNNDKSVKRTTAIAGMV